MTKIDDFTYRVVKGEKVKIKISFNPASQAGTFVVLTLDGKTLPASGSPLTSEFLVTKDVEHEHTLIVDCTFMPGTPASSRYDVRVSGSKGGVFDFAINKTDPTHDPTVVFMVVAG